MSRWWSIFTRTWNDKVTKPEVEEVPVSSQEEEPEIVDGKILLNRQQNLIRRAKLLKKAGCFDSSDKKLLRSLDKRGYDVRFLPARCALTKKNTAYSVGLFYFLEHPEVVIMGRNLTEDMARESISVITEKISNSQNLEENEEYSDIFPEMSLTFKHYKSIKRSPLKDSMGLAVIFYEKFLEHDDFPIVVAEVKNIKKVTSPSSPMELSQSPIKTGFASLTNSPAAGSPRLKSPRFSLSADHSARRRLTMTFSSNTMPQPSSVPSTPSKHTLPSTPTKRFLNSPKKTPVRKTPMKGGPKIFTADRVSDLKTDVITSLASASQ
eukprot:TRINITY_DN25720_c0_g1_i1.p1 TRINITY_DN25720_c0_g1~~TRINITY_DN25720_c0_g1_i1.p1  ORF type:complete len:322 (-),score=44.62 TRINITY_DN25720_c0_g1_i1:31-996(-)